LKIRYGLIEETYYRCVSKSRVSYGIAVYADEALDEAATVIVSVNDVCCDKQQMLNLIQQCNSLELSPIHLNDVIEDFLTQ